MAASANRQPADETELSDADFRLVSEIIHREAGIVVRAHKQAMVRGRLARRARDLGLPTIASYCDMLKGPGLAEEMPGLLNALTTNHTNFYREEHHFDHLEKTALPSFFGERRLRLWCAAASTGEEPYTIAATLFAGYGGRAPADCLVLATDLDSDVLEVAEKGQYPASSIAKLTNAQRERLRLVPIGPDMVEVDASFKAMLRFRQLNIIHDWPFKGPFHIIFCRNMLIYFDQSTKMEVLRRMTAKLLPGGFLYLGHSEALTQSFTNLKACSRTVYQRI